MTTLWSDEEMAALDAVIAEYQQRIAALEAEVERLRATPTEPTLDEMAHAISERKPFTLHGWGQTWSVHYWDDRTADKPTMSEAIRAAWEAVCRRGDA